MSFKQAVDIDELSFLVSDLYSSVEAIKEFGHVAIPSDEYQKLDVRTKALQAKLKECKDEFDKFLEEQTDWYSY